MIRKNGRVWFITGANKGMGAAIAQEALDRGYKVVATARNSESAGKILGSSSNLLIAKLDITNDEQVHSAVTAAMDRFGRIDVLPFGIRCLIVEPGPFRTDFANFDTSLKFTDLQIDDYKEPREALRNSFASLHQNQPGDPAKLAKALMAVVNAPEPPLRFLAGKAAVGAVDQYFVARRAEYDAWRELSVSTDYE